MSPADRDPLLALKIEEDCGSVLTELALLVSLRWAIHLDRELPALVDFPSSVVKNSNEPITSKKT
jgi:hypothetical protein